MKRWLLLLLATLTFAAGCGTIAPAPPDIPRVEFLFPMDGVTVIEGTDLQIGVVAQDSAGVARIELSIDDLPHQAAAPTELASVPTFTVDMNWLARGAGLHSLTAVAYRLDGTASDPAIIRVNVGS
ncbi:MAG: Ig-like domain-containing protein [Anaerolinea sp.]|nr:Ig-like domain-containing protein [Anaerolinea sp.]